MSRLPRLDAPGLLHHVMARGLNRQTLFKTSADYQDFLSRIEPALKYAPSEILAWAIMPNHVHLLMRSGPRGLSGFMRRLLTGFARSWNARHNRVGYVFQGRYKSLICEEDDYLLTLVRYIHLNPIAGKNVSSLQELRRYPYTGHKALMGKADWPWQSIDDVLGYFGKQAGQARMRYETFLRDGLPVIRTMDVDLLGGGLMDALRNAHGPRRETERALLDSRILGESPFVAHVWEAVDKQENQQKALKRKGIGLREIAHAIAAEMGIEERQLFER
jgi:putative transposase